MALSILNNIPSLAAQNQLSITSANLQTTLFRLSSGSRINSGADDAAGLAIADGLRANVSALTQSSRNATDGIGKLQVADGALAQVSNLLNRAVTLATEASTGTVGAGQRDALQAEFEQIRQEIDRIGTQTTFNGDLVFQQSGTTTDTNTYTGGTGGLGLTDSLTDGLTLNILDTNTGNTFAYTTDGDTVGSLIAKVQQAAGDPTSADYVNVTASLDSTGHLVISDNNKDHSIQVTGTVDAAGFNPATVPVGGSLSVYLSDGKTGGNLSTNIGSVSADFFSLSGLSLSGTDGSSAATALAAINTAVQNV
ncbi:MAG TPA: flagellin, partial [Terriglobales bacterium]|nr:flagellin [Terriglobales bacterium]